MSRFRSGMARVGVLALTTVVAAGCDTVGPDGTEKVQVTMQKIASETATRALADGFASVAGGSYAPIDAGNVTSLTMQVDSIQFLLAVEDGVEDSGGWITLVLAGDVVTLDLASLPPAFAAPLVIAVGDVDPGSYQSVRLFVSDAEIMFVEDVSVGQATFDKAPEIHAVTIPSGAQTGLKTNMAFIVDGSTDVNLLFDEGTTFQNATATGNGTVILSPVLRN